MVFADSESDSDDEIVEKNPPKQVLEEPPKKRRKRLDLVQLGSVLTAAGLGSSNRHIAKQMGVGESTIRAIRKRYRDRGNCLRKVGSGRRTKCSTHDKRAIMKEVRKNPFISAPEIRLTAGVEHVCKDTVLRVIHRSGEFNSYWAARKPFISAVNVQKRVEWCNRYKDWSAADWRKVLWSDESPFTLRYKGSQRVWRGMNQRYNPKNCVGTVKHDVKINVWGGFGNGKVGVLHVVDGIMEQVQYRNILTEAMLPSAEACFGNDAWIFQQDNDPKHTANATKAWFVDNCAPVLEWPSQSPDLNPIENLWSILEDRSKKRKVNTKEELIQELRKEWNSLSEDLLFKLSDSMPRRIQAVLAVKGWMTKY